MTGLTTVDIGFGLVMAVTLAFIAVSDFRRHIIPDALNGLLAGTGFAYQAWTLMRLPFGSVLFAILVFAGFWMVRLVYEQLRQSVGLGLGDVKMAAAAALWFDPWNLPLFMIITCCSALVFVLVLTIRSGRLEMAQRIPFGPFLGSGLFFTWLLERSSVATFIPAGIY